MGWTFGNLHIQKQPEFSFDQVIQKITAYYAQFGYGVCEETDAELSLAVLEGDDSAWISVYSDFFEDPQDREALGRWLSQSQKLRVLDIGCFDSDVLGLILYNPEDEEPAQAASGMMAREMGLSVQNEEGWHTIIADLPAFQEKIDADHVFAEETLDELAEDLRLPSNYSKSDIEILSETAGEAKLNWLYLSRSVKKEDPTLPKLETRTTPVMCKDGVVEIISAVNRGGEGQGMEALFLGSFVEQEEIRFEDVSFFFFDKKTGNGIANMPVTLHRARTKDGQSIYYGVAQDVPIKAGRVEGLPPAKRMKQEEILTVGLRFTPVGNPRKMLDIGVIIRPVQNPKGGIFWNALMRYGTKEAFIEAYNERQSKLPWNKELPLQAEDFD